MKIGAFLGVAVAEFAPSMVPAWTPAVKKASNVPFFGLETAGGCGGDSDGATTLSTLALGAEPLNFLKKFKIWGDSNEALRFVILESPPVIADGRAFDSSFEVVVGLFGVFVLDAAALKKDCIDGVTGSGFQF